VPQGSVLVTGGAGFIGSNLVRALRAKGETVVAFDNEFLGRFTNLTGVDCIQVKGDILDHALFEKTVVKHKVDRIVHLAGYTSAPMYDERPEERIRDNFQQFLNVLEMGRTKKIQIAYASTSSFYARSPKPFREDMPIVPGTPYELSKFIMEQAAHMYNLHYGVRANGFRFFSVYGPHETHKTRYANNISQFYWSIKNDVSPVVFGDGEQTRDFTFVEDLVQAILLILQKGKTSEVYNIGTGTEFSFNQMIGFINKALGKNVKPTYVRNPLKNYVLETLADTSKIQREIGWKATTTLQKGIEKLVKSGETFSKKQAEDLYAWIPKQAMATARK
jgi:UDP-glucose 4-epimerase